ncbi:PAS domain-containing protein [Egicoccus sp. AB-alg2]|uniref:PAS domain-containing protein n=1 Tax=Egicoccus sp. AB-alg2 TaxID=3242693 RepID=UPI00359EE241
MVNATPQWWVAAFERLADITPARIVVLRAPAGAAPTIEWANPSAARVLHRDPRELPGLTVVEAYGEQLGGDLAARLEQARAGGVDFEAVRDLPAGRQSVRASLRALPEDRFVLFALDVSAEREATRRLDNVTRVAGIGVYHWNTVENTVWWSPELYRLFGYDPGEVEATFERYLAAIHPDDADAVLGALDAARAGRQITQTHYRIRRPDGDVRNIEDRAEYTYDDDGRPLYVLGTVQDVTDRLELERQAAALRRATERQRTALQVHDEIVQGLTSAWLALHLGDTDGALEAIQRTTISAQGVVSSLLADVADARGTIRPGDLVREVETGRDTH